MEKRRQEQRKEEAREMIEERKLENHTSWRSAELTGNVKHISCGAGSYAFAAVLEGGGVVTQRMKKLTRGEGGHKLPNFG